MRNSPFWGLEVRTPLFRGSARGMTEWPWLPHVFAPLQKQWVKPRHVCTSDRSIHVDIAVVSAVLALNVVLTDTKEEGVVFQTRSQMWHLVRRGLRP